MWTKLSRRALPPTVQWFQKCHCSTTEVYPRASHLDWWGKRGAKPGYPRTNVLRPVGMAENLQERLDNMFAVDEEMEERINIGFAPKVSENKLTRAEMLELRRQQRSNKDLEKAARHRTLRVDLKDVKKEHIACGGYFSDIQNAADVYGIFEDLFGRAYFRPCVFMDVAYDLGDDLYLPVHRGNIVKPKEATAAPEVSFDVDEPDSLWTLVMSNPDGHFVDEEKEYLHWMVGNIPGNRVADGQTLCDYMQPFPAYGTGYQRFVFVLYKQEKEIDFSGLQLNVPSTNLQERTFSTKDFYRQFEEDLTPAGLSFFQSDYDSTLTKFFHDVLNMKEPKFEYEFTPHYYRDWSKMGGPHRITAFNFFLDAHRDPKAIQEEVLIEKLKENHPFKGDLRWQKYPIVHLNDENRMKRKEDMGKHLPEWRVREIERKHRRTGVYATMDWGELRKDPKWC